MPVLLWPDGNEVIPLIEMLTDGGFKSTHDFLGQLLARFALSKRSAVIANGGQNMRRVTVVVAG